jgi:galactokinase
MRRSFRAPGRVNLIGDHTDYNDGFVMPMAIQLETHVASLPRADKKLVLQSSTVDRASVIDLELPLQPTGTWTDYVVGVAAVIQRQGRSLTGAELTVSSTVPQGSGLSSSAALEVSAAMALLQGDIPDRVTLAQWCQQAENEFVGARCGIMDQYVSACGRRGHALLIDCRTLGSRTVPLPDNVVVIVSNSMVTHSIAAGEYNARREQCEDAVRALQATLPEVRALRDVTVNDLAQHGHVLSQVTLRRARHVVSENARVLDAAEALQRNDLTRVGELMRDSHRSLRDDFEVSSPELDVLVDIAHALPGVYGSRMTGGGFGGCTVTLAEAAKASDIVSSIREEYERRTGTRSDVIVCTPSDGASELTR